LEDFIEDLKNQTEAVGGPVCVIQKTVRVSISRNPVDGNARNAVKFDVTFQASAVIELEGGGEYLLQMGVSCGTDYEDATQEKKGTKKAEEMKKELGDFCDSSGLIVGPGTIEV
jgi:hypothetical protein